MEVEGDDTEGKQTKKSKGSNQTEMLRLQEGKERRRKRRADEIVNDKIDAGEEIHDTQDSTPNAMQIAEDTQVEQMAMMDQTAKNADTEKEKIRRRKPGRKKIGRERKRQDENEIQRVQKD